ncbi:MAG TPA: pitrilysin family protein [Polyangiaceae bacterium]|nr:pitrilysin family protein [Polyangiaceae bacterium]
MTLTTRDLIVETDHSLPLVHFSVALRTGAALDPDELAGLTRLTARLMRRSAGGRDADAIDLLVDGMGASFSADVGSSTVGFSGTVISRSFPKLLDLLKELLGSPGFTDSELQLLKRETLAELVEAKDNDKLLARRWFNREFFKDHPYGRSVLGNMKSLERLERSAVVGNYQSSFTAGNLLCCFAGDIDQDNAEKAAQALRQTLPQLPALTDTTAEPTGVTGRRLLIVDKPERTQTQILMGSLGTHTRDPDHVALQVANTVFGGTFTARLMQEVRAKRGWSYGANSSLAHERRRHAFVMWTFPKAEDCAPCIELELQLLQQWWQDGISEQELTWVKSYLTRSHAFNIDTCAKRASLAQDEVLYDLPPGYYADYISRINAVTLDQANAAIRNRIDPKNLLIVVVGTESLVGNAVRAAIPDLEHHDVVPFDRD